MNIDFLLWQAMMAYRFYSVFFFNLLCNIFTIFIYPQRIGIYVRIYIDIDDTDDDDDEEDDNDSIA